MTKILQGQKIAILIANGFDEGQMTVVQRALLNAGANVDTVSPEQGLANGWHGKGWGHYYPVDSDIATTLGADYDMLFIPGGSRGILKLKGNPHSFRIVNSFLEGVKKVAAIGHAVELLSKSQRLKLRKLTGSDDARSSLEMAEIEWQGDMIICQDHNLMTFKDDISAEQLIDFVIKHFAGESIRQDNETDVADMEDMRDAA